MYKKLLLNWEILMTEKNNMNVYAVVVSILILKFVFFLAKNYKSQ